MLRRNDRAGNLSPSATRSMALGGLAKRIRPEPWPRVRIHDLLLDRCRCLCNFDGMAKTKRVHARMRFPRRPRQPAWYSIVMSRLPLPLPPPGFDELPVEDQISYVQSLWDRMAAARDFVPLQEWQERLLDERLAAHQAAPHEARSWREIMTRVEEQVGQRK